MPLPGRPLQKKRTKYDCFGAGYLKDLVKEATKTHTLFENKIKKDLERAFANQCRPTTQETV